MSTRVCVCFVVVVHSFVYKDNVKSELILKNVEMNAEELSQSNWIECTHHFAQWTRALFCMCVCVCVWMSEWGSACVSISLLFLLILFELNVHSGTCVKQIIIFGKLFNCAQCVNVCTNTSITAHCWSYLLLLLQNDDFFWLSHTDTHTHNLSRLN